LQLAKKLRQSLPVYLPHHLFAKCLSSVTMESQMQTFDSTTEH
jgi:hypothetical protein